MSVIAEMYRLKHIVPFIHQSQSPENNSFFLLNNILLDYSSKPTKTWIPLTATKKSEQDIYEYILRSLDGAESPENKHTICSIWNYNVGNGKRLKYINTQKNASIKIIDFIITNVELYIFSNHVGAFCFELSFLQAPRDLNEILEIQCELKEYSYTPRSVFVVEQVFKRSFPSEDILEYTIDSCTIEYLNQYNEPRWIDWKKFAELDAERLVYLIDPNACKFIEEREVPNNRKQIFFHNYFNIGVWINEILSALTFDSSVRIEYFAQRKHYEEGKIISIPDKALLFSYIVSNSSPVNEDQYIEDTIRLANGYDSKYNVRNGLNEVYQPFPGITWYATSQGCGCIVNSKIVGSKFFTGKFKTKVIDDYFILYILRINQTLSLTYYAKTISEYLPSDLLYYVNPDKDIMEKLLIVNTEINLFLMKCVYTSVSTLQHQNDFDYYLKHQLSIEEDIDSLTIGIERLDALQENLVKKESDKRNEEMNRKLNLSLALLSLLAVISAICDTKVLFWDSDPTSFFRHYYQHPFFVLITSIIILIAVIVVKNIIRILILVKNDKQSI